MGPLTEALDCKLIWDKVEVTLFSGLGWERILPQENQPQQLWNGAMAPSLSAARSAQTLPQPRRRRRAFGCVASGQRQWTPCTDQHSCGAPTPGKPHLQDIHVRDSRGGVMVHQRPPKWFLSPCTRALHVMQNDATDTEPCKGQGQTFPCSGEAPGHIHPAQRCINPLDSILCDGGPSPPRRSEGRQQQDVIGTQGRVICFYLICPCHSSCASPTSFFYLFIYLFLFLSLCFFYC